jgi:hypothetical protein
MTLRLRSLHSSLLTTVVGRSRELAVWAICNLSRRPLASLAVQSTVQTLGSIAFQNGGASPPPSPSGPTPRHPVQVTSSLAVKSSLKVRCPFKVLFWGLNHPTIVVHFLHLEFTQSFWVSCTQFVWCIAALKLLQKPNVEGWWSMVQERSCFLLCLKGSYESTWSTTPYGLQNSIELNFSGSCVLVIENLRYGEFSGAYSFPHLSCTYWFFCPDDQC